MGLAISRRLIEMMGGEIWLESEYEKGTEFIFRIPFTIIHGEVIGEKSFPQINLKGLKALVVDDNPIVLKIIERTLKSFSFEVGTAESGKNAIRLLEEADMKEPYKLVIIDFLMPGMNGIETIKLIKENNTITHKPKFIMLTAHAGEEVMSSISQMHLDGFILKPITTSALLNTIIECFSGHRTSVVKTVKQKEFSEEDLKRIKGANVLLVEDNEINQEIAAEILKHMQFNVTLARDGYEAIDKVKNGNFDIVLMDIQMPKFDGIEATIKIRKDKKNDELPIVAMTAHAMLGDVEKSLRSGMNDHVTKPIDPDILFRTLVKWIKPKDCSSSLQLHVQLPKCESAKTEMIIKFEELKTVNTISALSRFL